MKNLGNSTQRDYLFSRLVQAFVHQSQGITTATTAQQSRDFLRWTGFLERSGIQDEYLDHFSEGEGLILLSAFASSIRDNENGKTNKARLYGTTVQAAVSNVCSAFRANARWNPISEPGGEPSILIKRQIRGYIKDDPVQKHQKCLPMGVFKKLYSNDATPLSTVIGELAAGALFFGMRSYEYSSVPGDRKTKLLTVRNVRFYLGNTEIKKSRRMDLSRATTVSNNAQDKIWIMPS